MADFFIAAGVELTFLRRAMIEAKLARLPRDTDLAGSPIVAGLATRAHDAEGPGVPGAVGPWRDLSPGHGYWEAVVSRALQDADWLCSATKPQREAYLVELVAPFWTTDDVFAELLGHIEIILETRSFYDVWLRTSAPYDGGALVVRCGQDGTRRVHDLNRAELFATKNRFDLFEWLHDRGFQHLGTYAEVPDVAAAPCEKRSET